MEGFLQFLGNAYHLMNLPKEVTKENVNMDLYPEGTGGYSILDNSRSFLELAIFFRKLEIFPLLIALGAELTESCAYNVGRVEVAQRLYESGCDLTVVKFSEYIWGISYQHELPYFLMDMGLNLPKMWIKDRDDKIGYFIKYFDTQVLPRISSCRHALLALLWCCTQRSSHGKGPFGALRDVMIQMATQVWCMRGGEGCGARAHGWIKL